MLKTTIVKFILKINFWHFLLIYCPIVGIFLNLFVRNFCPPNDLGVLYFGIALFIATLPVVFVILAPLIFENFNDKNF